MEPWSYARRAIERGLYLSVQGRTATAMLYYPDDKHFPRHSGYVRRITAEMSRLPRRVSALTFPKNSGRRRKRVVYLTWTAADYDSHRWKWDVTEETMGCGEVSARVWEYWGLQTRMIFSLSACACLRLGIPVGSSGLAEAEEFQVDGSAEGGQDKEEPSSLSCSCLFDTLAFHKTHFPDSDRSDSSGIWGDQTFSPSDRLNTRQGHDPWYTGGVGQAFPKNTDTEHAAACCFALPCSQELSEAKAFIYMEARSLYFVTAAGAPSTYSADSGSRHGGTEPRANWYTTPRLRVGKISGRSRSTREQSAPLARFIMKRAFLDLQKAGKSRLAGSADRRIGS
ncbi:hypothetical protein BJV78DRAFT_1154281 [Lactifluus subvellereus]|nr:hypothetical protein BJV78DRAFT_1154281 [Lactifluus subvellereus]